MTEQTLLPRASGDRTSYAVASFLARYRGATLRAYKQDLVAFLTGARAPAVRAGVRPVAMPPPPVLTTSDRDAAGNTSTVLLRVQVDRTAPTVTIDSGPAEGATAPESTSFTFTASEPGAIVECRLDAGTWRTCASPFLTGTLSVGSHLLELRAIDLAGNQQTPATQRGWNVPFPFTGFFSPIQNEPALNIADAGSAVPVTFGLGGDRGLQVLSVGSPSSLPVSCTTGVPLGSRRPASTLGNSGLQYDKGTQRYTWVWKTDKAWAGTCRRFELALVDGSTHTFLLKAR